ncbi:hypothetical protein [Clostridium sp.]|uniref:hypothetical protein n=1 Tax=Clostridium sp. TaxID=1506 RepID=UPI001A61AF59|nr:hypothetical protein [Clostridium sp.]MBK5236831.1 hypothetical protein [Clostridium sp.]
MIYKKYIEYISISCIFIVFVIFSDNLINVLKKIEIQNFSMFFPAISNTVVYIIFGIILGIGYVISENKNDGKWRFRISKSLIIGIPCLPFSFPYLIYYFFHINTMQDKNTMIISQIILGYTIISSFYKSE